MSHCDFIKANDWAWGPDGRRFWFTSNPYKNGITSEWGADGFFESPAGKLNDTHHLRFISVDKFTPKNQVWKSAHISEDGSDRYDLWRRWNPDLGVCVFIGLNPSTADASVDDPTIRRCMGFARDLGYGSLLMLNLFAFRATSPKEMMAEPFPVGKDNVSVLRRYAQIMGREIVFGHHLINPYKKHIVIAAWGTNGSYKGMDEKVISILINAGVPVHALKITKDGMPSHPLYLKKDLKPLRLVISGHPLTSKHHWVPSGEFRDALKIDTNFISDDLNRTAKKILEETRAEIKSSNANKVPVKFDAIGVDVGKDDDYTVITRIDSKTKEVISHHEIK